MNQSNVPSHPAKPKKRARKILIAAAILLLGGYLVSRVMNGIKIDDPLYDDSYDFMM
jgi:hypothetical protein